MVTDPLSPRLRPRSSARRRPPDALLRPPSLRTPSPAGERPARVLAGYRRTWPLSSPPVTGRGAAPADRVVPLSPQTCSPGTGAAGAAIVLAGASDRGATRRHPGQAVRRR